MEFFAEHSSHTRAVPHFFGSSELAQVTILCSPTFSGSIHTYTHTQLRPSAHDEEKEIRVREPQREGVPRERRMIA
jgi:hypothetical protein